MRVCLCSLYEKNCYLTKDVEFLLSSLKKISEHLIIIINGTLIDKLGALKLADKVLYRENKGFDGGAYKYALKQPFIKELIDKADELVLCNNTFYGPFVPFEKLFLQMAQNPCDFWGINLTNGTFQRYLQSYFFCFRKTVLQTTALYDFFNEVVKENTLDRIDVCLYFERSITFYLEQRNFKVGSLSESVYDVYGDPAGSIIYNKNPFLKKRAFEPLFFNKESVLDALCYIKNHFDYDVQLILDDVKKRYNLTIKKEEFLNRDLTKVPQKKISNAKIFLKDVNEFIKKHTVVYVYGVGLSARNLYERIYSPPSVAGFIVSNKQDAGGTYMGKSIFCIQDFAQKQDTPIIVALSAKNTAQVRPLLKDFSNVLYLW